MPKSLIITEKPSVSRDIVDALGGFTNHDDEYWESDRYVCTFAIGHILEYFAPEDIDKKYKRWTLENLPILPEEFGLKPKAGQSDRVKTIKKLMNRPDIGTLINACDAGREGELIFREIVKFLGSKKPIERLWLQSMTPQAIRDGFASLQDGKRFENLAAAAECRSSADWLIGMNTSRAMTVRLRSKSQKGAWSAGRVQTPCLAMLVEREREILAHVPIPYWMVTAQFQAPTHAYEGRWFDPGFKADEEKPHAKAERIFDETTAKVIVETVQGKPGSATETRKPSRETAPPLFDLTSLQRECNKRFGWTARRALSAAQRCYEAHKVLTYPRTDSRCLPTDYVPHVERVLETLRGEPAFHAGADFLLRHGRQNDARIFDDKGVSDHFAIIPTGVLSDKLDGDDGKLFDLVVRRFLAAFHPQAVWEQVERTTIVQGYSFSSRARNLREPGWRGVYEQKSAEAESAALPPLSAESAPASGVAVQTTQVGSEADATRPPPRITEARLLSLMENAGKNVEDEDFAAALSEKGLGTPATRAEIIENLKSKEYVDNNLRPTIKGMRFIDFLQRLGIGRITSAELTGELEFHLNQVERGQRPASAFMSEIRDYTSEIVAAAKSKDFNELYPDKDSLGVCPCPLKRPVFERSWFYRCQEDPTKVDEEDCPFRVWKDKSGRFIDRVTCETLLRDGKTGEVDGFQDRRGRTFKGILTLDGKEVQLQPIASGDQPGEALALAEFEVNPEPLGVCPITKDPADLVIETPTQFISQGRLKMVAAKEKKVRGFVLPRLVCKREMTRADALSYLATGSTPLIEDFISRFGRPFKAKLVMEESGRHRFEFPPREGGGKGRGRGRGKEKPAEAGSESAEPAEPEANTAIAPKKRKAPAKTTKKAETKVAKPAKPKKPRRAPAKKTEPSE